METTTNQPATSLHHQRTPSIAALSTALAKAQITIESAAKDRANPLFKQRYATLASIREACRIPLAQNGLAIMQIVTAAGSVVTVETILSHETGEWIQSCLSMQAVLPGKKEDGGAQPNASPQAIGSAITYARKYALAALVCVAPDDETEDDGNSASGHNNAPPADMTATERARREYEERARAAKPAAQPVETPPPAATPAPRASGKTHPDPATIPDAQRVAYWTQIFTDINTVDDFTALRAEFAKGEQDKAIRTAVSPTIDAASKRVRGGVATNG